MPVTDSNPPLPIAGRQFIISQPKNQPILFYTANGSFVNGKPSQGNDLDCRSYDQRIYAPEYSKSYMKDGAWTTPDKITFQFKVLNDWPNDIYMQCENPLGGPISVKACRKLDYYVDILKEDGTKINPDEEPYTPIYTRFFDDDNSQICFSIPIPTSYILGDDEDDYQVPAGCYYLRLGVKPQACPDERYLLATSQIFKIIDSPKCDQITIEWGNTNDAFDFVFNDPTPLFFTRVYSMGWKPKYPEDSNKFKDSKGNKHILYALTQEVYELIIDELPEYMHRALRIAFLSNYLLINGENYDVESKDYTPEWRNDSKFAQARIEITKSNDEKIKNNCGSNIGSEAYPGSNCGDGEGGGGEEL